MVEVQFFFCDIFVFERRYSGGPVDRFAFASDFRARVSLATEYFGIVYE